MDIYSWILALAVTSGQLIRLPIFAQGTVTMLDIAVAALCLLGLIKLKFKLTKPPLFLKSATIFISIAILSLILTPLRLRPEETLISFFYTVRFTMYILLCWLIFSDAFPALRNNIPRMLIFSGLGLAALGLLQFIFLPDLRFLTAGGWDPHYFRTVSTFLDPNFAGAFFVLTLLLLVFGSYLRGRNSLTPRVFYVLFAIVYLALLTTFSRSSYGMFLVSFTILAVLRKSWRLQTITILLTLSLMLGFFIYTKAVSQPRNINRTQSAGFRLNTWQQGFILFQKSPILGIGYNGYRYGLKKYGLGDAEFLKSHGSSGNDSSLLFVASTTGVVGLIVYICFLCSLVCFNHLQYRNILLPAISGLIVHSFFANSLFYPPILAWILLISITSKK